MLAIEMVTAGRGELMLDCFSCRYYCEAVDPFVGGPMNKPGYERVREHIGSHY